MSSIYRKGRDGYYYYQTYVRDPATGKKDKRIFHSLKTKDREEAIRKQNFLDKKYLKNKTSSQIKLIKWIKKNNRTILLVIFTSIITLYIDHFFNPQPNQNDIIYTKKKLPDSTQILEKMNKIIDIQIVKDSISNVPFAIIEEKTKTNNFENKNTKTKKFPSYKIERLERMAGSFEQGKIFLTVEKDTDNEILELLCEKIMKDYSEFSNLVICLYSSDSSGKNLANGYDEKVSLEEIKKSWLAMYTYNSVEGAYFDDKPSSYLGLNN